MFHAAQAPCIPPLVGMNTTAEAEATSDVGSHRALIGVAIASVAVNLIFTVATETRLRLIFWLRQQQQRSHSAEGQDGGATELGVITATPSPMRTPPPQHVSSLIDPRLRIQIDSTVKAAKGKRAVVKLAFSAVSLSANACIAVTCFLAVKGYAFGVSGTGALLCISLGSLVVYDPSMPRQTRTTFVFSIWTLGVLGGICAGIGALFALSPITPGPAGAPGLPTAQHPKLVQFHFMMSILMGVWVVLLFIQSLLTQPVVFVTKRPLVGTIDDLVEEQKRAINTNSKFSWAVPRAYFLEGGRYYALPIRVACNHFFCVFQMYSLATGFVTLVFVASMLTQLSADVPQSAEPEYLAVLDYLTNDIVLGSLLPMGLTFFVLNPLVCARPIRIWFYRRLAVIGTSSTVERRAVATNLLMGEEEPELVIERAKATFRGIPLRELSPTIFTAISNLAEIHLKTQLLELGACDAFVSHSWHDDWTLKYEALKKWGADYVAPSSGQDVIVWWDRACIQAEQSQISQALSCLPIYLSGCRRMVVLAGPSFPERLWCAMELFMFSELGGGLSCIDVRPFQIPTSGGATIIESFHAFEVARTHCSSALDKNYFISIIESAFGGEDPFNAIVRGILTDSKN